MPQIFSGNAPKLFGNRDFLPSPGNRFPAEKVFVHGISRRGGTLAGASSQTPKTITARRRGIVLPGWDFVFPSFYTFLAGNHVKSPCKPRPHGHRFGAEYFAAGAMSGPGGQRPGAIFARRWKIFSSASGKPLPRGESFCSGWFAAWPNTFRGRRPNSVIAFFRLRTLVFPRVYTYFAGNDVKSPCKPRPHGDRFGAE